MTKKEEGRLLFHDALRQAVESTDIPLNLWAERLGTTEQYMLSWFSGESIPTPQLLHRLMRGLRSSNGADSNDALKRLEVLLDELSSSVSRHDIEMHPKPGVYMLGPLFHELHLLAPMVPNKVLEQRLKTLTERLRSETYQRRDTTRCAEVSTDHLLFHDALQSAVESSGVPLRRWAVRLGVDESEVTSWLSGTAVPRPGTLHQMVLSLRAMDQVDADTLEALERVLNQNSSDVTPHDQVMHPSPGTYMLRPLRDRLVTNLGALPIDKQEEVLDRCLTLVADLMTSG